ncbi:DUF1569 domain-containing protein [Rhodoferax sp.]|uniref:DUF1569 domain-containing protein n=1 Tax=Rhodoferax sp. TaxID=50421 RepID=UPI002776CD1A|nr:DUF1569 domain-containing protein [Rhodoferax sp.]
MNRRHYLILQTTMLSGAALADTPKVQTLGDALRWLDRLDQVKEARSTTAWKLRAVLEHLAQSIEMSMDGFPEPKSVLFQKTAGAMAFAFFGLRGRMSHGLTDAIPGAPALPQLDDWKPGAARLRTAITRFDVHAGPLKPHFAYGMLSKGEFALAHTLHIANHQDEIVVT